MSQISPTLLQKIQNYTPSKEAVDLIQDVPLLCVAGITGAGKDTTIKSLLKTGDYHPIVSHTTRLPRVNQGIAEVNGRDYYFIDLATVENMIDNKGFIEVKSVHASIYGTSVGEFVLARDEGKIAVTDIDFQGIEEYINLKPSTRAVFLMPPSPEIWIDRLKSRYEDGWQAHREDVVIRLDSAKKELAHVLQSDNYYLVTNSDLARTVETVHTIAHNAAVEKHEPEAEKIARKILDYISRDYDQVLKA